MSAKHTILIVDDEEANLQKLRRTFLEQYRVLEASSGAEGLQILRTQAVSAIITDQRMPVMNGVELLKQSLAIRPDTVRIILTGYTEVEDLMDAINQGHVHRYITKPWEPYNLQQTVSQELKQWELERENRRLAEELKRANRSLTSENRQLKQEVNRLSHGHPRLIYKSHTMTQLIQLLDRVVKTDSTVLIQGETGTGKELLARYIQQNSQRSGRAFVPVNCGAVPHDLVESAFFGHRKGAFTGANKDNKGFFELAHGGTLFLDEIGEAPLGLQVKLLRVLQDGEIRAVGAQRSRKIDVRVIASTNRSLMRMVKEGTFRQDLFFRLNVFSVLVPPLRARTEDVPELATHFLKKFNAQLNKPVAGFAEETLKLLSRYRWPGNVRELENEVERLVILGDAFELIPPEAVSERIGRQPVTESRGSLKDRLAQLERQLILQAFQDHNQNKSHAAAALGISRQTIIAKLKQYRR